MARRYGEEYSPGRTPTTAGKADRLRLRMDPAGARANVLFLPPVILAFTALNNTPALLAVGLAGAGALALGAWLLRDGLRAEAAFAERKIARRPALPRKILAACLAGGGIAMAAVSHGTAWGGALVYGAATMALHLAAFGIDPLRDKHVEGIDRFQQDRVAVVTDEATALLTAMVAHVDSLSDRALSDRVAAFAATAREMIEQVENDPRDLTAARRYLGVYLQGARDAAAKYAALARRGAAPAARAEFEALLGDLESNYSARSARLGANDASDLAVEVEVLRERLAREGVTHSASGE